MGAQGYTVGHLIDGGGESSCDRQSFQWVYIGLCWTTQKGM